MKFICPHCHQPFDTAAMKQLQNIDATVFKLRYEENKTFIAIAKQLGISAASVSKRFQRERARVGRLRRKKAYPTPIERQDFGNGHMYVFADHSRAKRCADAAVYNAWTHYMITGEYLQAGWEYRYDPGTDWRRPEHQADGKFRVLVPCAPTTAKA